MNGFNAWQSCGCVVILDTPISRGAIYIKAHSGFFFYSGYEALLLLLGSGASRRFRPKQSLGRRRKGVLFLHLKRFEIKICV